MNCLHLMEQMHVRYILACWSMIWSLLPGMPQAAAGWPMTRWQYCMRDANIQCTSHTSAYGIVSFAAVSFVQPKEPATQLLMLLLSLPVLRVMPCVLSFTCNVGPDHMADIRAIDLLCKWYLYCAEVFCRQEVELGINLCIASHGCSSNLGNALGLGWFSTARAWL